jgi:hypothetical protein
MKEQWSPIRRFPAYSVSTFGRVKGPNGIKSQHVADGYLRVTLYRKGRAYFRAVHLLVAAAFLGPPPQRRRLVNHEDGNKLNPRLDNLNYVSHLGNSRHAWRNGLISVPRGTARPGHVLTDAKVRRIFALIAKGEKRRVVAARFGIGKTVLNDVIERRKWSHVVVDEAVVRQAQAVPHGNTGNNNPIAKLQAKHIVPIFREAKKGTKLDTIAADFGISRSLVSMVLHRTVWQHVAVPAELLPRTRPSGRLTWEPSDE